MAHIMKIDEMAAVNESSRDDRDSCYSENPSMKEKFQKFIQLAEDDDWSVYVSLHKSTNEIDMEIGKYSPADQDFYISISFKDNEDVSFSEELQGYVDSYDPEEEAELWSEESGEYVDGKPVRVGKNGAPEDWDDLVADMEACKSMMEEFLSILKKNNI